MKTQVTLKLKDSGRWIIVDKDDVEYSNCLRKGDAKKVLKTKKGENLELVEAFVVVEEAKFDKLTELETNFFYRFAANNDCGAETPSDLIDDNHSCQAFEDFQSLFPELNDSQIKGYISALDSKQVISIEERKGDCDLFWVTDSFLETLKADMTFESQIKDVKYREIKEKKVKVVKEAKSDKVKVVKLSKYETYSKWILANIKEDQLHSKSNKAKAFAKHFEVVFMTKYNRCRPFEEALKYMAKQETIIKLEGKRAIYKLDDEEL